MRPSLFETVLKVLQKTVRNHYSAIYQFLEQLLMLHDDTRDVVLSNKPSKIAFSRQKSPTVNILLISLFD